MFCVDMAPCWRSPCPCLGGGYSPSQGGGQISPGHLDCPGVNCRHVYGNTTDVKVS